MWGVAVWGVAVWGVAAMVAMVAMVADISFLHYNSMIVKRV